MCLAVAIDKYVYITLHETFVQGLIVKYSEIERVPCAEQLKHPIVRETLKMMNIEGRGLEIASHADIPAGTGLGSSSAFTCALIGALHAWKGDLPSAQRIAERACEVELDRLHEPIGKQDQYISAHGGAKALQFRPATRETIDAQIVVEPLGLTPQVRTALENNLLLFFTGYSRSASEVLASNPPSEDDLEEIMRMAWLTRKMLWSNDMRCFADMLSRQWQAKRKRSAEMPEVDGWYEYGMAHGALGGKLVGAGGGGFLLFYTLEHERLRRAMAMGGLREMPFKFDAQGTQVVCS